jgi:GT2 family glycosyltransferase
VSPAISVVINVLGRHDALARVLEGLERQRDATGSFEVVVAVDAAESEPDGIAAVARNRPYPIRVVRAGRAGASAARNAGWQAASAPLVLFLGADIVPSRRLVAEHLAWHGRHPGLQVAVLGDVRWARGLRVTPFMRWLDRGWQFDYRGIEGDEAGWGRFYTANVSVKRALLERVGGFDEEAFPFHYEDLDLARRMADHGLRVLYNRAARGGHWHPRTLEDWRARTAAVAPAERRFVARWPELPPSYRDAFARAAAAPPARGRGVRLARLIPRWVPVLGPRIDASMDMYFRQAIAPAYLAAWEEAGDPGGGQADGDSVPDREEASSGGS